jgi:ferredoxin-thioredoxin reductase catalytic subunit
MEQNNVKEILENAAEKMGWNFASELENVLDYLQMLSNDDPRIADDFEKFLEERIEFETLN